MRAVLCVALAGCQLVFPFDPGGPGPSGDAAPGDALPCTQKFNAAANEVEIDLSDETIFDPATSNNRDEMWLTVVDGGRSIHSITRAGQRFGPPVVAPFSNTAQDDADPSLTGDGELMLFLRGGQMFEVRRPFETPSQRMDMTDPLSGLDVTLDGLRVYYSHGDGIRMVERADRTSAFGTPRDLGIPSGDYPTISPDELEIYYNVDDTIRRRTRPSTFVDFGPEEGALEGVDAVDLVGGDAEIDPTGERLFYVLDDELFVLTRACQ